MKRSGQVGLVVMGGAAFAATFAGGMTYFALQKPGHAAQPQAAAAQQACTTRSDGTQNCQAQRRGSFFFVPAFSFGSSAKGYAPDAGRTSSAALTNTGRTPTASANASGTVRAGFGSTSTRGAFRASAGG